MQKIFSFLILGILFPLLSFSQDAPLWMRYPTISPDGKQIVFSYQGDLYKVNSQGGRALQLTSNKAYDYRAIWSPDGKQIVFSSNRHGNFDIFVMSEKGGSPKRLTYHSGSETAWSFTPDGKNILFTASISDPSESAIFPKSFLYELYKMPITGGRALQEMAVPTRYAVYTKDGKSLIYQDQKGGENMWRKHHTSSVTKDLWTYDVANKKHEKLTNFKGEDRNPILSKDDKTVYYLSEKSGSFNVWKFSLDNPSSKTQLTKFDKNPIRFLSASDNETLCFGFRGEIYTMKKGEEPKKVNISIFADNQNNEINYMTLSSKANEMSVSPNGKEIAFVVRGEIYVTSTEYSTTRRITNTPQKERSVSFSPDGKALIYAAERGTSWNIYQTKIADKEGESILNANELKETPILETETETFEPVFSPDGKEVAYLEERTTLKVINLASKKTRVILEPKYNYSYSDGDMHFSWSPDGKWIATSYFDKHRWPNNDIALIDASGNGKIHNLTESGYMDFNPKWMMNGEMLIWSSDRNGMRSHASWGSQEDVYAAFLTKDAYNKFKMSKEEYEIYKAQKKKKESKKDDKKKKGKKDKKDKKVEPIKIDWDGLQDRIVRLTIHSSSLSSFVVSKDGEKLYYLCKFEKGYDLWETSLRKKSTKLVCKLNSRGGGIELDKKGDLFIATNKGFSKFSTKSSKNKPISFAAEFTLNKAAEREYMFEHVWRQVVKKFYDVKLHGVDWNYYKQEYKRFLPYINNNHDYSELLSELLGELNASHTGSGYWGSMKGADRTAHFGAFIDLTYNGKGIKLSRILDRSPLKSAKEKIEAGTIIEKIDNQEIKEGEDFFKYLNHKIGKKVRLSLYNPKNGKRWNEMIKLISGGQESRLLYKDWVEKRRAEVKKLSNGRIGYVHIKGMNDGSFRTVYSDVFGKHNDCEAIIVDTRYNGGGHLHEDIEVLFSGKKYLDLMPRGQLISQHPRKRWQKPSIMLVSEANYSNAHGTPYVYQKMGIGKLVGMPVPGTMTSVWWETLQDQSMYFGIPQIGYKTDKGNYLENTQLEPDYKVPYNKTKVIKGNDNQLKKAVDVLLKELDKK